MSTSQFHRQATIQIGTGPNLSGTALQIQNLRILFHIKKTSTPDFNLASVQIYNLSKETRDKINAIELGNIVVVKAGYVGTPQEIIFVGNTVLSSVSIEPPNAITKIEAQDGKTGMYQLKFPNGISYKPGSFAVKILKDILKLTALDIKHIDWTKISDRQYKNGFCFQGDAKVLFTNVCNYIGAEWSIQNNQMKIIPVGRADTAKIIYLTPETGLIGSPEKLLDDAVALYNKQQKVKLTGVTGKKYRKAIGGGYKIKCLLQPFIEPGTLVQVKCEGVNDMRFRAVEVEHVGDTHGNEWHSLVNAMIML